MQALGYRQVLWIYRRVIEETGGSSGIRDEGLLRSALARPYSSFGGQDLYPTVFEKAAALFESLIRNHPFVDGNKRVAWECLDLFLEVNNYGLNGTSDEGFNLVGKVIQREVTVEEIASWLKGHCQKKHKNK